MTPLEWLCAKAPGFNELSNAEREAMMQFSLLWSLFENKALDNHASVGAITTLVDRWNNDGRLENTAFNEALTYYRNRYFINGEATDYFDGLRLGNRDNRELVEAMLKGQATTPRDHIVALFIVIYRLRNNLLHGEKWAYGVSGQLDNFTNANACLMAAIDMEFYL